MRPEATFWTVVAAAAMLAFAVGFTLGRIT